MVRGIVREPETQALWDVEWVDDDGVVIRAWRRLDREIAEHVAQRWLAARPQSRVALSRRVRVQDEERLELMQVLRADRATDQHEPRLAMA